jgi:sec-independent protein translocase protein TatC
MSKKLRIFKKKSAAKAKRSLPLSEHLREIRRRIVYVAILYLAFVIAAFLYIENVVDVMLRMAGGFRYVYLSPSELIICYMRLSLVFALAASSPFIAYHIWAFVVPALKKREKRAGFFALLAGFVFFILGVLFCYYIVLPFTLNFLIRFNSSDVIASSISVDSYTRFVMNTLTVFGLVFELPVITLLLSALGILKPQYLIKAQKYAILVIFIVAAVITPPDVVSQIMVAVPMILLYQLSILICRVIFRHKNRGTAGENDGENDGETD